MILLVVVFVVGLAAGIFFFASLRYAVARMLRSRYAAFWALGGFVLRTGVTLWIFYLAAGGNAWRLVDCLAGFVTARILMIRLMGGPADTKPGVTGKEASHEA